MPSFDNTKGQFLNMQQVSEKLKIKLPALGKLITQKQFPVPDKTTNGVQYWNARTVETWLGGQPAK
jgi:predicted DNA-binding transcriptional regulator AlpA